MVKTINIENKKASMLLKLEKLTNSKTIKTKEFNLAIKKIDENMATLEKQLEDLKINSSKYLTTKERKKIEPYIYCGVCRKTFYGITMEDYKKLLLHSPTKAFNTAYHKHRQKCSSNCNICGKIFTSHMGKKLHNCIKVNDNMYGSPTRSPTPEPVSSPEPIKCNISEIESDSDYSDWEYAYRQYHVGNKTKKVYDDYDEHIGYRYQNRLIHSEDELYDDFVSDLKDI
jgi:hypothetical protein